MATAKKQRSLARRAWDLLRMALIWARKHGGLKRRLVRNLRALGSRFERSSSGYGWIRHGEREMSFDETPTFRLGWPHCFPLSYARPPQVDFADDCDGDGDGEWKRMREELGYEFEEEGEEEEGGGVDVKAEEFIRRVHRQMRMQRQISLIQYNEMLQRGT